MLRSNYSPGINEAGCDEAGRGCLSGPVFAAAVILREDITIPGLDDSKKLGAVKREELRILIEEKALAFSVAQASAAEIDEVNILNASYLAMHRALDKLQVEPGHILIDGNRFRPYKDIPFQCIVKGDGKYMSIAAASILAKTYRDRYMEKIHEDYPCYGWIRNKGYPTKEHRAAIAEHGTSPHHRMTFRLLDEQLTIAF